MKKFIAILSILCFTTLQAYAGTVSFDQLATSGDLTVAKYNADLNTLFIEFNTNTESSNILNDTLAEADMADDINPRIRTFEAAACEKVDDGLLPATDSDLTSDISIGTAYPRGFRCDKTSVTAKTYTATKWTYVDIDQNCDFQFSEVAVDASAPAIASNSIRLARVSTDSSIIVTVTDLRTTSCAGGPFHKIADTANNSTLSNIFTEGQQTRRFSPVGRTPTGFVRGLFVSFDTHTTFIVTSGVAFINGLYRHTSSDISVPVTNDNPAEATSGLDTGAIEADKKYFVYAAADKDDDPALSISYSLSTTAPTGVTNARLLGWISTDADKLFLSRDVLTAHAINEEELIGAYINFNGDNASPSSEDSLNISGITDNTAGDWTITFDADFNTANYGVGGFVQDAGDTYILAGSRDAVPTAGALRIEVRNTSNTESDASYISVIVVGDTRR